MQEEKEIDFTASTNRGIWYFAHPYTKRGGPHNTFIPEAEEANFNLCNMRAGELLRRGFNIYSPISHTHPIHRASPTFLGLHEHAMWYALDNEIIDSIQWHGIILAPEWETSLGCIAEKKRIFKISRLIKTYDTLIQTIPVLEKFVCLPN